MCFRVDKENQEPWYNKYVYKIVHELLPNYYVSPILGPTNGYCGLEYTIGKTVRANKWYTLFPQYIISPYPYPCNDIKQAYSGIYTYESLKVAKWFRRKEYLPFVQDKTIKILELEVKPRHFLYHDPLNYQATYKKAKVVRVCS